MSCRQICLPPPTLANSIRLNGENVISLAVSMRMNNNEKTGRMMKTIEYYSFKKQTYIIHVHVDSLFHYQ